MARVMTGANISMALMSYLCEKLNIPPQGLIELDIHIHYNEPITFDARYHALKDGKPEIGLDGRFVELTKRLVLVDPEAESRG